jgi:hypothetical protein
MKIMGTEKLIQRLTDSAYPVSPLPAPWIRVILWLSVSVPYIVLVVYVMSPRADLMAKAVEARFLIEQGAALATGIAAAIAAVACTIPGYSRKILILPMLSLAVWLGALGQGCLSAWAQFGADGLFVKPDWYCFPAIVLVGSIPAVTMTAMLRRGAPLMPHTAVALGGLAAAGLGNFGLRLFHPQDASVMVLIWQFGTVAILACAAGACGHYLLNWRSIIFVAR